jgi:hypothetical protein
MATTPVVLYRGAAATSSTTLYTGPASTNTIITEVIAANTAGTAGSFTISLNGTVIIPATAIAANTTVVFNLSEVLPTTQILAGFASATTINFSISGVQIV